MEIQIVHPFLIFIKLTQIFSALRGDSLAEVPSDLNGPLEVRVRTGVSKRDFFVPLVTNRATRVVTYYILTLVASYKML